MEGQAKARLGLRLWDNEAFCVNAPGGWGRRRGSQGLELQGQQPGLSEQIQKVTFGGQAMEQQRGR